MENLCKSSGFWVAGVRVELKTKGCDLGLIVSSTPAEFFGAFTRNSFAAAPVLYCRDVLKSGEKVSHILVNSGNANACTGEAGVQAVQETVEVLRNFFPDAKGVLIASTGVIGHQLPTDKIFNGIREQLAPMHQSGRAASEESFCEAILTTDLVKKETGVSLKLVGKTVSIGGVCKGSGMIHPNMATMLAFLTTDIDLPKTFQSTFIQLVEKSFNSISVDGDQSTNDSVFLLANGVSGVSFDKLTDSEKAAYIHALETSMISLARQIAADGEGATKLVEIQVSGAASEEEAQKIARQIANSPLIKTALFGKDPNWGRIVAAIGSLDLGIAQDACTIGLGNHILFTRGSPQPKDLVALQDVLSQKEVVMTVKLLRGQGNWKFWTCDFSYDYVKINAEYHT